MDGLCATTSPSTHRGGVAGQAMFGYSERSVDRKGYIYTAVFILMLGGKIVMDDGITSVEDWVVEKFDTTSVKRDEAVSKAIAAEWTQMDKNTRKRNQEASERTNSNKKIKEQEQGKRRLEPGGSPDAKRGKRSPN